MAQSKKFYFWEERNILLYGDDAPISLHIKGNVQELKKLKHLIDEAIQGANEGGTGWGDDDIDQQYVLIEAYADNRKIKPDPPCYNPFEIGIG